MTLALLGSGMAAMPVGLTRERTDGLFSLGLPAAHADDDVRDDDEDDSSGHGSGHDDDDDDDDDDDGDNSGHGGDDDGDDDNSGHGHDDDGADDNGGNSRPNSDDTPNTRRDDGTRTAATVRNITVTYADGWVERIVDGQYELLDNLNRRVILRTATPEDFDRMFALR